jgi:hypothetical protein
MWRRRSLRAASDRGWSGLSLRFNAAAHVGSNQSSDKTRDCRLFFLRDRAQEFEGGARHPDVQLALCWHHAISSSAKDDVAPPLIEATVFSPVRTSNEGRVVDRGHSLRLFATLCLPEAAQECAWTLGVCTGCVPAA